MRVKPPSRRTLHRIAESYGFDLTRRDLREFQGLIEPIMASYERLDQLPEPELPVKYPRTPGYRPSPEENPLNAWYWRCDIQGAESGLLAGKTVAIKDNVPVAGIPMMNGTAVLEGYVPDADATIVTRILDAGGRIMGKAVCESMCISGGSHTSDTGPVQNPWGEGHSAGGSSSGSGALVASGAVDMAIGGDQGGSIRIPASWCRIVGLKPTYGLVPYTGIFPIEMTLDHTGPMARTAADCALLLEAIAGPDGLDPRQNAALQPKAYSQLLSEDVSGLRIGVLQEGFGLAQDNSKRDSREASWKFEELGATVTDISVPMHLDGTHIWNGIGIEGLTLQMIADNGMGNNWKGHYSTSLLDAFARGRRTRANDFSETVKMVVLLGQYLHDDYHGRYYAKAQNLARSLKAAYDKAFEEVDLLLMPTLPMAATPIPSPDASREDYVARALEMIANTAPFDITGHPAITFPSTPFRGGDIPTGTMLVGRTGEDETVLSAAHAFQQRVYSVNYSHLDSKYESRA